MLDTRRCRLLRFPLHVDPVVSGLEVLLQADGRPAWRQCGRVRPRPEAFNFTPDSRMVHFFGLHPKAEDCPFLLVYDATGVLRFRLDAGRDGFEAQELAEEANGRPAVHPSVRLVFDDDPAADRFAAAAEDLVAGRKTEAEVAGVLARSLAALREVRRAPVVGGVT